EVELDSVDGQLRELAQGRVADAEAVEHYRDAGVLEPLQGLPRARHVAHHVALRDLHLQSAGSEAALLERVLDLRDEVVAQQLRRREVDGEAQAALTALPGARLKARGADDPGPDREDEPGEVGPGEEVLREHEAEVRVLPAQERLHPRDLARGERVEGLVEERPRLRGHAVDVHLSAGKRGPEADLELEGIDTGARHGTGRGVEAVASRLVRGA